MWAGLSLPRQQVDSEYAATARQLAARLVSLAQIDEHGEPFWTGDEIDPMTEPDGQPRLFHTRLNETLLVGRAGIALSLAVCAQLPHADPRWQELARKLPPPPYDACNWAITILAGMARWAPLKLPASSANAPETVSWWARPSNWRVPSCSE